MLTNAMWVYKNELITACKIYPLYISGHWGMWTKKGTPTTVQITPQPKSQPIKNTVSCHENIIIKSHWNALHPNNFFFTNVKLRVHMPWTHKVQNLQLLKFFQLKYCSKYNNYYYQLRDMQLTEIDSKFVKAGSFSVVETKQIAW